MEHGVGTTILSSSGGNPDTINSRSRMDELIEEFKHNNSELSAIKEKARGLATGLGGHWPLSQDPEEGLGKQPEPTKLEMLTDESNYTRRQLQDLRGIIERLSSLV